MRPYSRNNCCNDPGTSVRLHETRIWTKRKQKLTRTDSPSEHSSLRLRELFEVSVTCSDVCQKSVTVDLHIRGHDVRTLIRKMYGCKHTSARIPSNQPNTSSTLPQKAIL
ncbi:unnamed protein product [Albugo candida]|uniref:Uncharacterized protein n=1 Tax=Albugo candida TaxID=65357 RepID=A0A024GPE4_9STRA|nr:unnamed protein product [Albugo candida]|eukprot:CCI48664.1 unnamed protein product [Albugo candida]